MSSETSRTITDFLKWIAYGSLTVASILVYDDFKTVRTKVENIEMRTIRIEYELKLRPTSE